MIGTSTKSAAGSRCVLLHAPGSTLPADLVLSLERRGVEIIACTSSYTAMARVCMLERENDERTDDPALRDSLVLVLVSPKSLGKPADLVDAMRRYASRTACWWYDASANPRLRAVVDADIDLWLAEGIRSGQPMVIRPRPGEEPRPRLKLSGDGVEAEPSMPGQEPQTSLGNASGVSHTRIEPRRHGTGGMGGGIGGT